MEGTGQDQRRNRLRFLTLTLAIGSFCSVPIDLGVVLEHLSLDQIANAVAPALISIASDVDAGGKDFPFAIGLSDADIEVQDEIADLLHPTNQRLICAKLIGNLGLAAIAAMEIACCVDRVGGRRNVDYLVTTRFGEHSLQIFFDHREPCEIIRILAFDIALQAAVDQLETEDGELDLVVGPSG